MNEDDWGFDPSIPPVWRQQRPEVPPARIVPQDVVLSSRGVHRVGDKPREKKAVSVSTSTEVVRVSVDQKKAQLVKLLSEFAGLQALMDRFGGVQPPIGTVLRWVKKFDARSGELRVEGVGTPDELRKALTFSVSQPTEYVYLGFRAPDGKWYTTSRRGVHVLDWDGMLAEIGDNECEIASEWTNVPAPEKVDEAAIDPTEWARAAFGKKKADTPTE